MIKIHTGCLYQNYQDDEVSQGYRIIKNMGHGYNDNLMSDICGFKIGLDYNFQRMRKDKVKLFLNEDAKT